MESLMNKKINISFLLLTFPLYIFNWELIEGDKNAPEGQTFSFSVKENVLSNNGTFYEGANEVVLNNEFSLSRLIRGTKAFAPLTPEKANFNTNPDSENPLFGAKI